MTTKSKNPHIGSSFDDFLKEEEIYDEVTARAIKRAIALQIADEMTAQNISKAEMARRMNTSATVEQAQPANFVRISAELIDFVVVEAVSQCKEPLHRLSFQLANRQNVDKSKS